MRRVYRITLMLIVEEAEDVKPVNEPALWDWAALLDLPDAEHVRVLEQVEVAQ